VGEHYRTFTEQTIADYLVENQNDFSEFINAMKKANVYTLMESYGKYTCFIPTNQAVNTYCQSIGITSLEDMNEKDLRELVFYHFIDGDVSGGKAYFSYDFQEGAIGTLNMIGRNIYTSFSAPNWMINKTATIISPDIEAVNGVIHVVDQVLEGNKDLLPDLIESDGRFSIFAQALRVTNMRDSIMLIEDDSYVQPSIRHDGTANGATNYCYPPAKKYGYTALVESDSILKLRENITNLDGLRAYAKRIYDAMYPNDANVTDETDRRNSLNRFVSYHLINKRMTSNLFVHLYNYTSEATWYQDETKRSLITKDGKYTIGEYLIPMTMGYATVWENNEWVKKLVPNTLIYVQKGNIFNTTRNVFIENLTSSDEVIRLIADGSNIDCQNGVLHSINNMMVYDAYMENTVLNRRLRMDVETFLPEALNNNAVTYVGPAKVVMRDFTGDYFKNLRFKEELPAIYLDYEGTSVRNYLYGDVFKLHGFFDARLTVGPIPAGSYEVRFGYSVNSGTGIIQFYMDGKPCGIPLDLSIGATTAGIGWEKPGDNLDDPDGYENDKNIRNRGYMKAPDSFTGSKMADRGYGNTGRDDPEELRRILGTFQWDENSTHEIRIVQVKDGEFLMDYFEFIPTQLIKDEDTH